MTRPRVILESPYAAPTIERLKVHVEYARRAMIHSIQRGEAPFASHLVYPLFLEDDDEPDRALGIACGFEWLRVAEVQAFYVDMGWSPGMLAALKVGRVQGIIQEVRSLKPGYAGGFPDD